MTPVSTSVYQGNYRTSIPFFVANRIHFQQSRTRLDVLEFGNNVSKNILVIIRNNLKLLLSIRTMEEIIKISWRKHTPARKTLVLVNLHPNRVSCSARKYRTTNWIPKSDNWDFVFNSWTNNQEKWEPIPKLKRNKKLPTPRSWVSFGFHKHSTVGPDTSQNSIRV